MAFDDEKDAVSFMKLLKISPGADKMVGLDKDFQTVKEVSDTKTNYGCRIIDDKLRESLPTVSLTLTNLFISSRFR